MTSSPSFFPPSNGAQGAGNITWLWIWGLPLATLSKWAGLAYSLISARYITWPRVLQWRGYGMKEVKKQKRGILGVKRTHVPMILRGISRDPGSTNILLRIVMVTGVKVAIIRATIIHVVFTNSFFFFFLLKLQFCKKKSSPKKEILHHRGNTIRRGYHHGNN